MTIVDIPFRTGLITMFAMSVCAGCGDKGTETTSFNALADARGSPIPDSELSPFMPATMEVTADENQRAEQSAQPSPPSAEAPMLDEDAVPVAQGEANSNIEMDVMDAQSGGEATPEAVGPETTSAEEVVDMVGGTSADEENEVTSPSVDEPDLPPAGPCPPTEYISPCLFERDTVILRNSPVFSIREETSYASVRDLSAITARQLVHGINCRGLFSPQTPEDAFGYVDAPGITAFTLRDQQQGRTFTWLRYYSGDTEVGFIYQPGTLDLLAYISDGDLLGCQVSF